MDDLKKVKAVLFDLDGTILDTTPGIYKGTNFMLPQFGLPQLTPEQKKIIVGPPLSKSYPEVLGFKGEKMKEAISVYRGFCKSQGYKYFNYYPEMTQLLEELKQKGIQIFVVTMKEQSIADLTMDSSGYDKLLDGIYGNNDIKTAPKSELINKVIAENNLNKDEVIFIGDTDVDAEGAAISEVDFYPAMFGFGYTNNGFNENYPYRNKLNKPLDLLKYIE